MPLPLPDSLVRLAQNPYLAVGFPVVLGIGSGLVTRSSVNIWYKDVRKPPYEPPRAAFPIAWTYLYATMGYASHLISLSPLTSASTALSLYYAQLGLNLVWTPTFFGFRRPDVALIDIVALTGTVFTLTSITKSINRTAFYLLCAWLSFATYLNAGVFWLNGGKKFLGFDKKGKAPAPGSAPEKRDL